jgi:hypothetical protein
MKKSTLRTLINEIIQEELTKMEEESQAAKDAKSQGLISRGFGRWGKKGGPITHTTQGGKLVPLKTMNPIDAQKAKKAKPAFGDRSPEGQRLANIPRPNRDADWDAIAGDAATRSGNRIVAKVQRKFWDTEDKLLSKYDYYQDIPADEFTSATGIPKKAAVWASNNFNQYEAPFSHNPDTDTFQMHDPMDI